MISAEYLAELKQKAESERSRLLAQVNQATGAIGMLEVLIRQAQEPVADETPPDGKPAG